MLKFKLNQHGIEKIFAQYIFVPGIASMCIYSCFCLATGIIEDHDTTGKLILEIIFGVAAVAFTSCLAAAQVSQWVFMSEGDVQAKALKPWELTLFSCQWVDVAKVQVWSDRIPSDPQARIKKIIIRCPPYYVRGRYQRTALTITDHVPEIRQVMDFIDSKVSDRVIWEMQ